MKVLKNSRRMFLSMCVLTGAIFSSGCETNTNDPLPTGKTLTVGGKVNSASHTGTTLTFSPSSQFYTARFYAGTIPFSDLRGTGWQGRPIIATLVNNETFSDGNQDWSSPFNLANVTGLESGQTYTMQIFYTSNMTDANQQGTIVFTR
ncbi:MAG TPA: hypothetical protein VEC36_03545 [Patescibacteria group bacterium]|nr:hypothetical protein [Patescibacteria group bacterium]